MGFSGGGSNVLKPHKHSSAVQDGSPLNMVNVTEGSLNAGDVIYSDGAALQRLAIGTPAQQIQVNAGATAPEYFTPAAASAVYEEIASTTLGGASNNIDLSFVAVNGSTVAKFVYVFNGGISAAGDELAMRVNGDSSANYFMQRLKMTGGAGAFSQWANETHWKPYSVQASGARVFGLMDIQVDQTSQTPNILMSSTFVGASGQEVCSGNVNITAASLSEVEIYAINGGSPTITAGSTASLFKVNI